jgi:hypothetical protein
MTITAREIANIRYDIGKLTEIIEHLASAETHPKTCKWMYDQAKRMKARMNELLDDITHRAQ